MMTAFLITIMTVVGIMAGAFAQATPAIAAVDCSAEPMGEGCPCSLNSNSAVCKDLDTGRSDDGSGSSGFSGAMKNVTNTLFFAVGILAVIMIIVSSIRYVTARGDSGAVAKAKNTMIYSVAGLIVAMLAFVIVRFITDNL